MVSVFMRAGPVMVQQTAMMAVMKQIVVVVHQNVKHVNMIGHLMEPNAVIQPGTILVLPVLG